MQSNFYFIGNFSNIYKKPSSKSEVTSQIIYGEKFKILSKNKNWIKIKISFDNYKGFIRNSKYIKKFSPNYKVSSLKARIFKKPGIGTNSWLPHASKLSAFEQNKNYVKMLVIMLPDPSFPAIILSVSFCFARLSFSIGS